MFNRVIVIFAVIAVACLELACTQGGDTGPELSVDVVKDAPLPDFARYKQVKEKKLAFFNYMLPFIEQENQQIEALREKLLPMLDDAASLNSDEKDWLYSLAKQYGLGDDLTADVELVSALLLRVDQIPPSLALAQAANESAWGTSRFAVNGNNMFGQWCFRKGCGIVPNGRENGAEHEVATFSSPRQSVKSYIHNLNTFSAYQDLRRLRAELRQQHKPLTGDQLADGLLSYSTRKQAYVDELKQMIRFNKLDQYDTL